MQIKHIKFNIIAILILSASVSLLGSNQSFASSVSISAPNRIDLELIPENTSDYSTGSGRVMISTTRVDSYSVYITSDTTNLNSLHHNTTIPSITKPAQADSLPVNTWGVAIVKGDISSNTIFNPISTTPSQALTFSSEVAESSIYSLAIAAKVDTSLPAGSYYNDITISVVAKPSAIFGGIITMQDMTPEICNAALEHDTIQLTDSRDSKTYWVTKLKDGRCWMTQNLALSFSSDASVDKWGEKTVNKLTSQDSDVATEWSYSVGTVKMRDTQSTTSSVGSLDPERIGTKSVNFGKWVLATPLLTANCGTNLSNISQCTKVGFVDVSNSANFKLGYKATTSNWQGANATNNTLVAVNCTEWSGSGTSKICVAGEYDEHYLVGAYYQRNAAMAGVKTVNTNESICPKGWQLPDSGAQATTSGLFWNMLQGYGLGSTITSKAGTYNVGLPNGAVISSVVTANQYNVAGGPLYLMRAGYLPGSSRLDNPGANGTWWGRTGGPLYVFGTSVDANYGGREHYDMYNVRCVNAI